MPTPPWSKRSLAVQAMGAVEPVTKAVVPPIHLATTFIRDEDNAYSSGFVYGRPDNATVRQAEASSPCSRTGPRRCSSPPAWRPRPRCSRRSTPATTSSRRG